MDILDRIKRVINESIQPLFVKQEEDLGQLIRKDTQSAVSDLKYFISQQAENNGRDMGNMLQLIYSLNQTVADLSKKIDAMQKDIAQLKERQRDWSPAESIVHTLPSIPRTYYAKMVDSTNPLGFRIESLKSTADGCAFKITITDDRGGTFETVDDREIQQEMLSAFNPLISDSSDYAFVPQYPTGFNVVSPGTIVKENNVFQIVNKQRIEIF